MSDSRWTISTDPSLLQLDRVYGWLAQAYWSLDVRRDVVERAFANSLVAGAYADDGSQLGVARVVTDQATFAWLCDVFVEPAARGHGIARGLTAALIADPRLQTLRRWSLATRDAHGVYAALGFAAVDATRMMELLPDPARWRR
jgi:GNAT superfamily N-acetyltransferase